MKIPEGSTYHFDSLSTWFSVFIGCTGALRMRELLQNFCTQLILPSKSTTLALKFCHKLFNFSKICFNSFVDKVFKILKSGKEFKSAKINFKITSSWTVLRVWLGIVSHLDLFTITSNA